MAPERVVLPKNVTPVHYDLKLTPNLETFVFSGEVAIRYLCYSASLEKLA